jgi:hypothetical protein
VVEIVYDEETARAAWADNVPDGLPARSGHPVQVGIYGDLDEVDGTLDVVETSAIPDRADGCNDSRVPYRVVLALDRDRLPEPDDLPMDEMRLDGRDLTDALVTTYPAAP